MSLTSRAVLLGLTISLLGGGAVACTASDNGGVIQGPAPTTTATTLGTTSTTLGTTSTTSGTLPSS